MASAHFLYARNRRGGPCPQSVRSSFNSGRHYQRLDLLVLNAPNPVSGDKRPSRLVRIE
jgi:hypothetical protein